MKGGIKIINAKPDGPGKAGVGNNELRNSPGSDLTNIHFSIGLECATRTEDGHPLDGIDIAAHFFAGWKQEVVFHIKDPRSTVGSLE